MIFNLVFDRKYSTHQALIHITDEKREQLNSGNFDCGIFVDLQNASHPLDQDTVIQKGKI